MADKTQIEWTDATWNPIRGCSRVSEGWPRSKKKAFMAAVNDEVLLFSDDGRDLAYDAAIRFEFEGKHPFQDFWEISCSEFTYHYLWCCYAIAWAVKQYDTVKDAQGVAA